MGDSPLSGPSVRQVFFNGGVPGRLALFSQACRSPVLARYQAVKDDGSYPLDRYLRSEELRIQAFLGNISLPTNEYCFKDVIKPVGGPESFIGQGGGYVGVGCGLQNLTYAAHLRADFMAVVDYNPFVVDVAEPLILSLVLASPSRIAFLANLMGRGLSEEEEAFLLELPLTEVFAWLQAKPRQVELFDGFQSALLDAVPYGFYRTRVKARPGDSAPSILPQENFWSNWRGGTLGRAGDYLAFLKPNQYGLGSFLESDASYNHVHRLIREGRFFGFRGDWTDPQVFTGISAFLAAQNSRIKLIYLSNLMEWFRSQDDDQGPSPTERLKQCLELLPAASSGWLIRNWQKTRQPHSELLPFSD